MRAAARGQFGLQVQPGISSDMRADLRFRDADQNDWLGMLHKYGARDHRIVGNSGDDMDWFAGITGRSHEIGCQERVTDHLGTLEYGDGRNVVTQRTEPGSTLRQFGRRQVLQETRNLRRMSRYGGKSHKNAGQHALCEPPFASCS